MVTGAMTRCHTMVSTSKSSGGRMLGILRPEKRAASKRIGYARVDRSSLIASPQNRNSTRANRGMASTSETGPTGRYESALAKNDCQRKDAITSRQVCEAAAGAAPALLDQLLLLCGTHCWCGCGVYSAG